MISQRAANLIFAAILAVAGAYMAWLAWAFETPALGDATLPTHFFPLALLGFTAFCMSIYVYEYGVLGQSGGDGDEKVYASKAHAMRSVLSLLVACMGYFIWIKSGFVPAALFVIPALSLAMGVRRISHLMINFAGAGVIYLVFTYGLGTQFQ